jgi:predicted O-methyltransferase YrrM
MTRERAKWMDQASFWAVDVAGPPRKLYRPTMASPQPGRMIVFAPVLELIWGMSVNMDTGPEQPLEPLYRPGEQFEISARGLGEWHRSDVFQRLNTYFAREPLRALQSEVSCSLIYHVIMMHRPKLALEIGTYHAGTSEIMARALWEAGQGHLETIDPFGAERCPPIIEALPGELRGRISFLPISSAAYFDQAISGRTRYDLVLIDGNHEFEFARFDLECTARLINPGGIVILDNIEQPGPRLATELFVKNHPEWEDVAGVVGQIDPTEPLAMPTPSFPGTVFYVLRAPAHYVVRNAPTSFGPIVSDSASVDGVDIELCAPARGTLHVQVFARTFGELYPEELKGRSRVEVNFPDAPADGRIRIPLDRELRSHLRGEGLHHRVEIVLAFSGKTELALRMPPAPYPAKHI